MKYGFIILLVIHFFVSGNAISQSVPAKDENIPFLVTFGSEADSTHGDDDFSQVFFFVVPTNYTNPFYIRVWDPDIGGAYDEKVGDFDTEVKFYVYGGVNCISNKDSKSTQPKGDYKSGTLLSSKTFSSNSAYDNKWYTFGPFNPKEGENMATAYNGYVFKVIAQGIKGDDGNLYRYFMSTKSNENVSIEGGNVFTFEYTFRMWDDPNNVSHVYPYIDQNVKSIKISNFDMDGDGSISIISVSKAGKLSEVSGNGDWVHDEHQIVSNEKNTSIDIQLRKDVNKKIKNNNIVLYVTNQYGESLPFFVIPIGGVPKYKPDPIVKKK